MKIVNGDVIAIYPPEEHVDNLVVPQNILVALFTGFLKKLEAKKKILEV